MTRHRFKTALGIAAAGSLLLSSTAAMASNATPTAQVDPWAVLTAMSSGAPAAAMCGSAAAASAQAPAGCVLPAVDAPPPPPVQTVEPIPAAAATGGGFNPLILALLAIAAGVGIYLAVNNGGGANSPA